MECDSTQIVDIAYHTKMLMFAMGLFIFGIVGSFIMQIRAVNKLSKLLDECRG